MSARYRDDPNHPSRLNRNGGPEPTRQPRYGNRLYCMVWVDHDLFKVGLSSGRNRRDPMAVATLRRHFAHDDVTIGPFAEWRADVPALEGAPWGDCQRFEMVFATVLKRRLRGVAAGAVGLEWLTREELARVRWKEELTAAVDETLRVSGLDCKIEWLEARPPAHARGVTASVRLHGPS